MLLRRSALAILFLLASIAPSRLTAGLIVNGGFETGDFTGWTVSGGAFNCGDVIPGITSVSPHSGSYAACFGNLSEQSFLYQAFPTVPGQTYLFSIWLTQEPSPGQMLGSWVYWSHIVTATDSTSWVQIAAMSPGWVMAIDDIDYAAVPEPSALLPCVLLFAGSLLYRRQIR